MVFLKLLLVEENGFWIYRFFYKYIYKDKFNDVRFYGFFKGEKIEISVLRLDGVWVFFYRGLVIFSNMSFNINMCVGVVLFFLKVFNFSVSEYVFVFFVKFLFFCDSSLEFLKGEYIFEVCLFEKVNLLVEIFGICYGFFGIDFYGRDMWVGFVKGMNNIFYFVFFMMVIIVVLGVFVGMVLGYVGGILGEFVMFILEVLMVLFMFLIFVVFVWFFFIQGYG